MRSFAVASLIAVVALPLGAQQSEIVARAMLSGRAVAVRADELSMEVTLLQRAGRGPSLTAAGVDSLQPVLELLLRRKLFAAEAQRRKLEADASVSMLLSRASELTLADALASHEAALVDTSEAAVQMFFRSHPDAFRAPPRRKARHIVVPTEAEVKAARAAIAAGATFETVARERNTDATKPMGGDLGWIAKGTMVKAFDEVVFGLGRGTISAPVQTAMGWHLVLVEDIDPGNLPPLALVRDRVIESMRQDVVTNLTKRLFEESNPVIDRVALEGLLK